MNNNENKNENIVNENPDNENISKDNLAGEENKPEAPAGTEQDAKAAEEKKLASAARKRRLRYGGAATVITVIGIVVIIIINMVATSLTNRFGLTVDMTGNSIFKLSEKSINYVKDIDKDVNIYILLDEDTYKSAGIYYASSASIIENYSQINSHIKVSYEDIISNPTFVSQFPELTLSQGDVVIACGDRAVSLKQKDLVSQTKDKSGNYTINSTAEQSMTSAILTVTSDEQIKVSILTGYDNADASAVAAQFSKNNYIVTEQSLLTEEIDPDAEIIVLFGIKRDLDEESIKKIETYLDNDEEQKCRALYYFVSSETSLEEMKNFGALLRDWGISVSTDYIYETNSSKYLSGYPFYTIPSVVNTNVSGGIENKNLYITMFNSRRVELVDTGYSNEALLQFSDDAMAFPLEAAIEGKSIQEVKGENVKGACAAACTTVTKYDGTTPLRSRIIVFSSDAAFSSTALTGSYYGNADYLMSLSNTVTDNSTFVYVAEKNMDTAKIAITGSQVRTIMLTFIFICPIAVLAAGTIVWIKRRHR